MPCIMPEMPYCPVCKYGHVIISEDAPDADGTWVCLCTDENIQWFGESTEPPKEDDNERFD